MKELYLNAAATATLKRRKRTHNVCHLRILSVNNFSLCKLDINLNRHTSMFFAYSFCAKINEKQSSVIYHRNRFYLLLGVKMTSAS